MTDPGNPVNKAFEYITDFMYFVVRPYPKMGPASYLLCSGVNVSRFLPVTRKRHGLASNPSLRGLELVNLDVRVLALARGAKPKANRGHDCLGITPTPEIWYSESLQIDECPPELAGELIPFCVPRLLKKITHACGLTEVSVPATLPTPEELHAFVESLVARYGTTG